MKKNFSNSITPTTGQDWKKQSEESRIKLLSKQLKKNILYEGFDVVKAPDNGQIVLKIKRIIPANERGILLLDLEEMLKSVVDRGITVWCEPVGDKSKLRQLRGVKIKT
jgi:Tfp pilus assembly protein PilZ